jgi:phosphate transport system protein
MPEMTSHYEERLEADLTKIRDRLNDVGVRVEQALSQAVHAVLTRDVPLAYQIVLGDMAINRSTREIDRMCHAFVARHLPSAGHLRFISAVLRMTIELERAGDYAVTIARESIELSQPLADLARRELERMTKDAFQMLRQSLRAFRDGNADLAKGTMAYADQVERSFSLVFEELLDEGQRGARPIQDLFATFAIFNRIERVSDKAKNICEQTVFAVTGETKQPKVYRILFMDEANDYYSQIAEAIGRKAYPESGEYVSAGLEPAKTLNPGFIKLMDERGLNVKHPRPTAIDWVPEEWSDFHIIVSLEGPVSRYLENVPFRTVALEWKVPPRPDEKASPDEVRRSFEETYRVIANEVGQLMEMLRGDDAS